MNKDNGNTGMGCPGGESISGVEAVLNCNGIALKNAAGGFRSLSDVLNELGEKWGQFTAEDKRTIAGAFTE